MPPKLYALDSKGDIKLWYVTTEDNTYTIHYGKDGGKIQSKTTTCTPKNVGKKNETTAQQQAVLEAEAKWRKQKDKSYCEDKDNIQPMRNPMLAMDYRKAGHRIKFPASISAKMDGVRTVASLEGSEVVLKSRGGKVYPTPKHLVTELTDALKRMSAPLDGELYLHGLPLNEIQSAAKCPQDHPDVKLGFAVFDMCNTDLSYAGRLEVLNINMPPAKYVTLLKTQEVSCEEDIKLQHDVYVKEGYEGIMVRNLDGLYKYDTRSPDLQKYKEFKDAEYRVVGIKLDKDGRGVFTCDCPDSLQEVKTFDVVLKGTHEDRQHVADHPEDYVGKWLTVQYQVLTPFNVPEFPVGLGLRNCDEFGNPVE